VTIQLTIEDGLFYAELSEEYQK